MKTYHTMPELPAMPMGIEIRHVPKILGYAASTDGKIWSCKYRLNGLWKDWGVIVGCINKRDGHRASVFMMEGGSRKSISHHRIVLLTFVGPPPSGMECCHGNGNPADNRLENLRWDTKKSNRCDFIFHLKKSGGIYKARKLSQQAIDDIRSNATQRSKTHGIGVMASKYGVTKNVITQILKHITYKS